MNRVIVKVNNPLAPDSALKPQSFPPTFSFLLHRRRRRPPPNSNTRQSRVAVAGFEHISLFLLPLLLLGEWAPMV